MTSESSVLMDSDAANKAADADMALQELGSDLIGEAYVTATVTVWDEDARTADERRRLVEKTIQGHDFTCIREGVNAVEAWLGSLPGHLYANVCQPPISTLNLAHMMPFSAVWAGPARDEHFDAPALFVAKTEGSTPFRFSLHVGDVGHTLIVGPTGAGKSVLLAVMAMQLRRYDRAQIFDFAGSIRAATLAMGGDWHDLGGSLSEDAAEPVALQPLARIHLPEERAWAAEWVAAILGREKVPVTPDVKELLWAALGSPRVGARPRAYAHRPVGPAPEPGAQARASALLPEQFLGAAARRRRRAAGRVGRPGGRERGPDRHRRGSGRARLPLPPHRGPARRPADAPDRRRGLARARRRGLLRPAPRMAEDAAQEERQRGVFTQSLADIDNSPIAPAIIESCPTRVFLANERGLEPQIAATYRRFGLSDRQIEILSQATPKRDYYCQSRRGNRLFELGLGEVALAFAAASSKTD